FVAPALWLTSYIRNLIVVSPHFLFAEASRPFRVTSPYCHVEQAMAEIDMGIYNSLFRLYIEACAVTQYHGRGAKPGGWGGHATIFMNGAESDPGAGYPCLRLASAGADRSSCDSGLGGSADQLCTKLNWVAIRRRRDLFPGDLGPQPIPDGYVYQ